MKITYKPVHSISLIIVSTSKVYVKFLKTFVGKDVGVEMHSSIKDSIVSSISKKIKEKE
jgi:hypothetical protein